MGTDLHPRRPLVALFVSILVLLAAVSYVGLNQRSQNVRITKIEQKAPCAAGDQKACREQTIEGIIDAISADQAQRLVAKANSHPSTRRASPAARSNKTTPKSKTPPSARPPKTSQRPTGSSTPPAGSNQPGSGSSSSSSSVLAPVVDSLNDVLDPLLPGN